MKKLTSKLLRHTALAAVSLILSGTLYSCMKYEKPNSDTQTSGTMTLVCDNSFQNIMEQEIEVFEFQYPDAHILSLYTPEKVALDSLMKLKTKTIVIPRDLTKDEVARLKNKRLIAKSKKIAVDAVALIVNPSNPVDILTVNEIKEILTGSLTDWNEVQPCDLGTIKLVFDHGMSSTVQYMRDSLMDGRNFGPNVFAQDSIQGVFDAVKSTPSAIGVVGVTWLSADLDSTEKPVEQKAAELESDDPTEVGNFDTEVKVLKVRRDDDIRAYQPYQQYIYDGSYPLFRQIYMITVGANGGLNHGFFSFVTGKIGQKIILRTGICPAVISPQVVSLER